MDDDILVQKWMITFVQDNNLSREMDNIVNEDDDILVEKWMIT